MVVHCDDGCSVAYAKCVRRNINVEVHLPDYEDFFDGDFVAQ